MRSPRAPLPAAAAAVLTLVTVCCAAPTADGDPAEPAAAAEPTRVEGTLDSGGATRSFLVDHPGGDGPVPMIIALHGKGGTAEEMAEVTGLTEAAAAEGMGVAYPEGIDRGWGDHREPTDARPDPDADIAFLTALADHLAAEYGADRDRVYLAGVSNGGNTALRAAAEEPEAFAGVATAAAQLGAHPEPQVPEGPVPALLFYGTGDPLRPYDGLPDPPEESEDFPEPPIASIGARDTAEAFADASGADRTEDDTLPDTAPDDGTTVERTSWYTDDAAPAVRLYTVHGGGHTWPGGDNRHPDVQGPSTEDVDASALVVEFFARR
ncbi:alpha/beta hydrolase family esterase [Nocardiopsis trehalosi]|uniref:alpha/beta hydrolase family esterase n=1 Tax=Nocardiopsis trehalosi TaxID=109329 RepID=UPI00082CE468|nr:PHB depolymerase family esterase [Nocardiopsis trehalosi]